MPSLTQFLKSAVLLLAASPVIAAPAPAGLILQHGAIYAGDAARSWAQAVAVSEGRIVYSGTDSGASEFRGPHTRVIDLGGRMVLPGFHDSHVHLIDGGESMTLCALTDLETPAALLDAIAKYAHAHPSAPWIAGSGWQLPLFPDANPRKELLDRIVADRPVYMDSSDGHSAWVNSKALAMAGITKATADPPHGRIERDPATGEPSGTLRESAVDLVSAKMPVPSAEELLAALRRGQQAANRFGITSIQEANAGDALLDAYRELDRRGELTVRAIAAMTVDPEKSDAQVDELVKKRARYQGRLFHANAVKLFADGVIEPHTAAMLEPYLTPPAGRGSLNYEPERLKRLVTAFDRNGFQVHIHAIGDRAVRAALDADEAALRANGAHDARHHIAHLEVVEPEDIPRFRKLGVVANFQALWAFPDAYITDLTVPSLGAQRSRWLYPIGSIARTGAILAGGSDWPVSSLNPIEAMQVAVTRRGIGEPEGPAWIPEERVDLATMIAAYTIGGAWVNHEEKVTGSLEPGKSADLIVLDRNLFDVRPEKLHEVKVLLTLLEGREVFRDPSFGAGGPAQP